MLGIAEIMTTSPSPLIDPTTPKVPSISTEITIGTIIVLVFVIAFRLFLQLYSKRFSTTTNESSGLDPAGLDPVGPPHPQGLDPATLDSLPVVEYNPKDFKDGLECFVCICEISQGEKTRILPKCNHGFHLECIDMWFYSHSTCPLCRIPVIFGENLVNVELQDHENEFATSYDESLPLGSTSGGNDHEVVVEIPSGGVDDEFCEDCLPSPKVEAAKTAVMWRLVSLKRLLSLGKRQGAKTKSYHRIAVVC